MKPLRQLLLLTAWLTSAHPALSTLAVHSVTEPDDPSWMGSCPYEDSSSRVLIYGGDQAFPPYEYLDKIGRPAGFNVELVYALARELEMDLTVRLEPWSEVRRKMNTGDIDLASMFYSEERNQTADFSVPLTTASQAVFAGRDSPSYQGLDSLRGRRISVQAGDLVHDYLLENGFSDELVLTETLEEALRLLADGKTDFTLCALLQGRYWIQKNHWRSLDAVERNLFISDYCFAVPEGRETLLRRVNEGLALLKESGEYRRIYNEHLGAFDSSYPWTRFRETLLMIAAAILLLASAFGLVIYSLNRKIRRHTAEIHDANTALKESRLAALNMMEDALLAKEKLEITQYALDHAADPAFWIRPDGSFAYVNEEACRALLYSQEDLLSMSFSDIDPNFNPDQWSNFWKEMKTLTKSVSKTFHQRKNGTVFPVELYTHYLKYGDIECLCVSAHDIADRTKRNLELKRLSAAIEQAVEMVVITDPKGRIEYVNPAFEAVTGYTRSEVIGQNPRILNSGEQTSSFYTTLWHSLTSGMIWNGRFINRRKNGTLYTEEATISPVRDSSGAITGYVAVKRDISEALLKEEHFRQNQKIQAIGQLAGGIAHDFNNILQAILGFSEILLMRLPPKTVEHKNVTEIQKAAEKAAGLTRQLLTFSRKQAVDLKKIDLKRTVQDAEGLLKLLCGEKINVSIDLPAEPCEIISDHSQITQVLINLAVNARDAMPEGGSLAISLERVHVLENDPSNPPNAKPGEFFRLSFTDTGCGMNQEVKDHLFEPFFTTKEIGKGTGLGLSVVYGIVQQNKGWVDVYSEQGHGTSFKLYLSTASESSLSEELAPEGQPPDQARILFVEDDANTQDLVLRILEPAGYEVVIAGSAEEAIHQFNQKKDSFDLLVSDIVLPGQSGLELADWIRAQTPSLPVLLCSGYQDQHTLSTVLKSKKYHFIQKPFSLSSLMTAVYDALHTPS